MPGGDHLADDLHGRGTDALAEGQAAVIDGILDRLGQRVHGSGGGAERADPERLLALQFHEGCDPVQDFGDIAPVDCPRHLS